MNDETEKIQPEESTRSGWNRPISRRTVLTQIGAAGVAVSTLGMFESLVWQPDRVAAAPMTSYPDIQFDIGKFVPPARYIDDVLIGMPPVYTVFLTAQLTATPTRRDQHALADALDTIEQNYPFRPEGVFLHVSYGRPYFNRLPGGMVRGSVVAEYMPVFKGDFQPVLQEAIPGPTDVSPTNPTIKKKTFNVPLTIEANDILFTLRGDSLANITDIIDWLRGSNRLHDRMVASPALNGLFTFTSKRLTFVQIGLPAKIGHRKNLAYADRLNPRSPMWMGFFSQQANGFSPATIATFQGNDSARFDGMLQYNGVTRPVVASDYFYDGSVQVLSHDILDLAQWYADSQPYSERAQLMFRSNPPPNPGYKNQFANGGGPAALPNLVVLNLPDGASDALLDAEEYHRVGHLQSLQRVTRTADGSIVPQRIDGPGFDAMDVPDGSVQPKLQFSAFVPSAQNFAKARLAAGAPDLCPARVPNSLNGIEPFMTATRRQNFLCPPRKHRAFPLLELL
ncbi:MAG: hypothetical protein M3Z66_15330 [Chloroflexota bacterium]|nr:hypothetical protein [Chloroflexota bacterium]